MKAIIIIVGCMLILVACTTRTVTTSVCSYDSTGELVCDQSKSVSRF